MMPICSDVFFEEVQIPKPDYFLGIGGKNHGTLTEQMIEKIEVLLVKEQLDWVMMHGDTNSTLAESLAVSKLNLYGGGKTSERIVTELLRAH